MAVTRTLAHAPRWYLVPARILLLTLLFTMLCFAVSLLIGILALVQGVHPNMTVAYRRIAFPAAILAGVVALILATVLEIRHYRQTKALAEIERAF